ncbi:hypothetical protein [Sedimentisphaera salicampi]|uniref:Uncharacterized protein n=1 Tax=Sedimentisphaera salicampi TaxID=1941349 RepID=A0A1W6LL74_9BACT|nr:hypothetical protein [Sedimentisphaera salicampi]ARN56517.1 hypothetical protein STSP1_00900 [Sedimentisphaera salicampi]
MCKSKTKKLNIVLPAGLISSKAFRDIKTATAHVVLMELYASRRMVKNRNSNGKHVQWSIANNGQIVFPYKKAKEKFGYGERRFKNAIDHLEELGFINIERGGGLEGNCNSFWISERWRKYGTSEFEPAKPPPKQPHGFKKGNKFGRNCKI